MFHAQAGTLDLQHIVKGGCSLQLKPSRSPFGVELTGLLLGIFGLELSERSVLDPFDNTGAHVPFESNQADVDAGVQDAEDDASC